MNIIELSNDFCQNYLACIRRASSILNITHTQAMCLQTIPFSGISQAELAKKLNIDISTLSRNLDKLVKLKLVDKKSSLSDKRSFIISLTDGGKQIYNKFNDIISEELGKRGKEILFHVVSNPEFLKEGDAIQDFLRPDRVIIGTDSEYALGIMKQLYAPFTMNHDRLITMGIKEAEFTKYAANAMLATKISFINEMAHICDELDIDVEHVRKGIGSDSRIGHSFIYPGVGYGGSCFPKDVKAIIYEAKSAGVTPYVLDAVEKRNQHQKGRIFQYIKNTFENDLEGKIFTVWGLSFKPGTDDMRKAPSINVNPGSS